MKKIIAFVLIIAFAIITGCTHKTCATYSQAPGKAKYTKYSTAR